MITLYVLDVEDFRPLASVATQVPGLDVRRRGPYLAVSSEDGFTIDRKLTGCRNAVWYSSVAAVSNGRVARWDRDALQIQPVAPLSAAAHG